MTDKMHPSNPFVVSLKSNRDGLYVELRNTVNGTAIVLDREGESWYEAEDVVGIAQTLAEFFGVPLAKLANNV